MLHRHILFSVLILAFAVLAVSSCSSPGSGGGSDLVSISGSATTTSAYYSGMQGTPTIALQQANVTKYSLVLSSITNGWNLASTKIAPGTYDILVTAANTIPPYVTGVTVNGIAINPSTITESAPVQTPDFNHWTCVSTIPSVPIAANADVEITISEDPQW